jgi:hypothetical protein
MTPRTRTDTFRSPAAARTPAALLRIIIIIIMMMIDTHTAAGTELCAHAMAGDGSADVVFTARVAVSTRRRPDRRLCGSRGPIPQTSSRNDGGGESHVDPLRAAQQVAGRPLCFTDSLDAPRSGHELAKYRLCLHPRELCAQA